MRYAARQRGIIGAVTDGHAPDAEAGVVEAVVTELRGEVYRPLRAVT